MASEPDAPTEQSGGDHSDPYPAFRDHVQRYSYVGDAAGVLRWDQEVMMPEGGTPARAKQNAALSTVRHELLVADELADWLDDLGSQALAQPQAAVVREVRREHERASEVPSELVQRLSEATSNALPVWKEAKENADFEHFADTLEELIELRRDVAAAIDPDRDPYEVLFEEYEPYLGIETAERVLDRLSEELPPLIDAIANTDVTLADPFEGSFDDADQEALVRAALDDLGYDWDRGRLDTAPHPFSTGTMFDARVTTRFRPDDPLDALSSTIHEFGHAQYTLGLPDDHYGTPLGQSRDLTVHESQSRLWENHVARSRPFWEHFAPRVEEHLGVDASPHELYEAANRINPENTIRVEADELTYHMHIVLRFEIERDLIRGDMDVDEVPGVWNDKMEEYLGIRPDSDADGALQDIHWTHGSFGYFPTYTLGSVLAAQLAAAIETTLPLDEQIAAGEFDQLREWLQSEIHAHGCRYTTDDLIREATDEAFTADYFLEYATEKFGRLYEL